MGCICFPILAQLAQRAVSKRHDDGQLRQIHAHCGPACVEQAHTACLHPICCCMVCLAGLVDIFRPISLYTENYSQNPKNLSPLAKFLSNPSPDELLVWYLLRQASSLLLKLKVGYLNKLLILRMSTHGKILACHVSSWRCMFSKD